MTRLSLATLDSVPATILRRRFPGRIETGIVHFGPGAFHRAHQAAYIDRLLDEDPRWGIFGIALRSGSTVAPLVEQDGLYTLAIRDRDPSFRIVAAHTGAQGPGSEAMARLIDPSVRLVTATVTEKGYCLAGDGTLDFDHPSIVHDLTIDAIPQSLVGWLVAGLARRRNDGVAAFGVLTCDNMADNGVKLRNATVAFARRRDAALADWIAGEVRFPNSMVDSITPAADEVLSADVTRVTGLDDRAPVQRETFAQWVIEDQGSALGPDLGAAGVILTSDVAGYERAKLRILNGAHSALAYRGLLLGYETVFEAISDPELSKAIERMIYEEVIPALPPVPGLDLRNYAASVFDRLRNPAIRHRLIQIAMDGSQKLPYRLLDSVATNLKAGRSVALLAEAVAAWIAFAVRETRAGRTLADPLATQIQDRAEDRDGCVRQLLEFDAIFPAAVGRSPTFRSAVENAAVRFLDAAELQPTA